MPDSLAPRHVRAWPIRRGIVMGLLATMVGLSSGPGAAQAQPAGASAPQQPARPTFRADVNAVQIDLRVVDRNGQFVSDLGRDEFRIFEDGVEQTIANFELVNIPIDPPRLAGLDGPRVDPDVASNGQREGRLFLIVLDDLEDVDNPFHANPLRSPTVRALASAFIERNLADNDRAALVTTSGRRDMAQELTNNRRRLLDAANRYQGGYGQVLTTQVPNLPVTVSDNLRSTMVSLTALARWLAQIDGRRKAIVLISERLGRRMAPGVPLEMLALSARESDAIHDFVGAAARGNVSLYVIDPVGVPTGAARGIRPVQPDIDDGSAFDLDRIQSLVTLSEATGGFAAVHTNDWTGAFERIVSENSSYYLLGYVSSNLRKDGKARDIDVRVTRPNLRVRARSGYVAPRETTARSVPNGASALPPALDDLLRSPLAVSGLPLRVTAPVFRSESGSKATVAVVVEAGASQLLFTSNNGRSNAGVTLVLAAADMSGKTQASERGSLALRLSAQTHEAVLEHGARVVSQLELKPGRYQLRVAALDAADGATRGSVLYDLDVPDFSKGPLTLSGVALSSITEAPVPTVARNERLKQLLGEFPTARREFTRFEELGMFFEVYDNDKRGRHSIVVTSTVLNASGAPMFRREVRSDGAVNADKTVTHRMVTTVPLNELRPGRYVMQVEAQSSLIGVASVSRQIPFSIR